MTAPKPPGAKPPGAKPPGTPSGKPGRGSKKAAERQARLEAARAAAEAQRRAKTRRIAGIAGIVVVSGGIIAIAAIASGGHETAAAQVAPPGQLPKPPVARGATRPPWAVPADTVTLAEAAGLRALTTEGEALHFHPHLDILVNGAAVTVPADIGIDTTSGQLSELHTHDTTGVLHVEAPDTGHRYVLGQLFAEWNVRLDATHIGGLTASGGDRLTAYVDGKKATGDPAQIELTAHKEIALVFGQATQRVKVPDHYDFASGE